MNETKFGMWCAHGEGKIVVDKKENKFIPILKYDEGYPLNPNGSHENIAGVVNQDGRILGLMPHFERSFLISASPRFAGMVACPKTAFIACGSLLNFANA